MIRDGDFGTNFEIKLLFTVVAIGLCFIDWGTNGKRKDYFWVFLFGTVIWTATEVVQKLAGVRDMMSGTLFGLPIPDILADLLQGTYEGAFIAIFGIFVADRLISNDKKHKFVGFTVLIGYTLYATIGTLLQANPSRNVGGDVASRRNMLAPMALIFLSTILVINILWMVKRATPSQRKRALVMYVVMVTFASIWTLAEFLANTRWIEIGTFEIPSRAPPAIEFLALAWDVTVEIAAAYVTFLILPYFLSIIKERPMKEA